MSESECEFDGLLRHIYTVDVRFYFATVCGVEWNVYAAAFTPQNGATVHTDSVRTKAYLQNSETCMRNLHW